MLVAQVTSNPKELRLLKSVFKTSTKPKLKLSPFLLLLRLSLQSIEQMANSGAGHHAVVPSASQQTTQKATVSNAHADRPSLELEKTLSVKIELEKTLSTEMMENHSVEEHLLKELRFARFIAKCPCALCWIVLGTIVLLAMITGQVNGPMTGEMIAFPERGFAVDNDHYTEQYDAYNLAADFVVEANDTDNSTVLPQTESVWSMAFYFTDKNYDNDMDSSSNYWILTKEHIATMIEYENKIMEDEEWKRSLCYVRYLLICCSFSLSLSFPSFSIAKSH